MTCGIYKIENKTSGEIYVGQNTNIESRWKQHIKDLNSGRHHNKGLFAEFSKPDCDLEFSILQECSPCELSLLEDKYIKEVSTLNKVAAGNYVLLSSNEEEVLLECMKYYVDNKKSSIPEIAEKFGVSKKTLYNIKSGTTYIRNFYNNKAYIHYVSEPTRYNTNKDEQRIEEIQTAVNLLSSFKFEVGYIGRLFNIYSSLSQVLKGKRFKEVNLPTELLEGIEYMGKYRDALSDDRIHKVQAIFSGLEGGKTYSEIGKEIGTSRTTVSTILKAKEGSVWGFLKKKRPDLWRSL